MFLCDPIQHFDIIVLFSYLLDFLFSIVQRRTEQTVALSDWMKSITSSKALKTVQKWEDETYGAIRDTRCRLFH